MTSIETGLFFGVLSFCLGLLGKALWDYWKDGRIEKEKYLTVQAFENHRKECCAIGLKLEFNKCQQEACADQARTDNRLLTIEEKLRDGQITFQSLNDKMDEKFGLFYEKFEEQTKILSGIQAVLEFALEQKDKGK